MRQRGHLLTIYGASGVQGETTAGDIHWVWYRMEKVTALKGVKPAPGANTSHTNHAPVPPPAPFQRRTSPPRRYLATAPPSAEPFLTPAVIKCYPCLPPAVQREPLITPTVQTRWLYLIKEEWAALSNLSSETNTEPGSAFTGRALGMRWSKLGQCRRCCYQWKLRVSSKAAVLSPFLEQQHGTGLSM